MKRLSKFVMEEKLMLNIFKKNDESLWKFSVIPGLERFYDLGIAGLVRENIQNSLDGKIPGETKPVIVTIRSPLLILALIMLSPLIFKIKDYPGDLIQSLDK